MTDLHPEQLPETGASRRAVLGAGALSAAVGALALARPTEAQADPRRGSAETTYDVTEWKVSGKPKLTPFYDIGAVINDIIRDIKTKQRSAATRTGAAIIIPPGRYDLRTQVRVDLSYLTVVGYGHGFYSRSIDNNSDTSGWLDRQPGGSHVRVLTDGAAFLVKRADAPRMGSVEFRDFCLDGVDFTPDQNSYTNGRTGIEVASDNDSFWISGMGFVYLERALVVKGADALKITGNMIAECGSCIELTGAGQATLVSTNLLGAGPKRPTLLAENHEGLLITGNNIFPRGESLVELNGCTRSSVTGNRLQGFYPGMVRLHNGCKENLVSSNHFRRAAEGYPPFLSVRSQWDDVYGVVHVQGDNNFITGNLFAYDVPRDKIVPATADPTMILIASGDSNTVATNHVVSNVPSKHVVIDGSVSNTVVIDSGTEKQIVDYSNRARVRYTP